MYLFCFQSSGSREPVLDRGVTAHTDRGQNRLDHRDVSAGPGVTEGLVCALGWARVSVDIGSPFVVGSVSEGCYQIRAVGTAPGAAEHVRASAPTSAGPDDVAVTMGEVGMDLPRRDLDAT